MLRDLANIRQPNRRKLRAMHAELISGHADRGDVGPRDGRPTELCKNSIQVLDLESGRRSDLDPDGSAVRGEVDDQPVARLDRPLRTITVAPRQMEVRGEGLSRAVGDLKETRRHKKSTDSAWTMIEGLNEGLDHASVTVSR